MKRFLARWGALATIVVVAASTPQRSPAFIFSGGGGGGGSITHIHGTLCTAGSSGQTTTYICTIPSVPAGNSIIGLMQWQMPVGASPNDYTSLTSIIDNGSGGTNSYDLSTHHTEGGGSSNSNGVLFRSLNIIHGSVTQLTATVAGGGGQFNQIVADEYSHMTGADTSQIGVQVNPGTGSNLVTTGNFTLTHVGPVLVWAVAMQTSGTPTITAGTTNGFTQRVQDTSGGSWALSTEDKAVSGTGSLITSATFTTSISPGTGPFVTYGQGFF